MQNILKSAKILKELEYIWKICDFWQNILFLQKNGKICEKIYYIFSHIFPIPSHNTFIQGVGTSERIRN